MKRTILLLLALFCLFALSCGGGQTGDSTASPDSDILPETEAETFPAETAERIGVTDEVMAIASAAIHEAYPDFDMKLLDYFNIEQTHNPTRGSYLISCWLYLCGMKTTEYFGVNMSETDEGIKVDQTSGSHVGEYSKYLTSCTPEKIQKAKEKIEAELGEVAEMHSYHLRADGKGRLVLTREEIYTFSGEYIGTKGFSDHEHVFFRAIVCGEEDIFPDVAMASFSATLDYATRDPGYPLEMTAEAERKLKELIASAVWAGGSCDCHGDFLFEADGISIAYNSAHPHLKDMTTGRYGFLTEEQGEEFNALLKEMAENADYSRSLSLYQYP